MKNSIQETQEAIEQLIRATTSQAISIATLSSKAKIDVSDDHFQLLQNYISKDSILYDQIYYAHKISQYRRENREELEKLDYLIISLGVNCLPRTVLTRWGLKPTKSLGEASMPFDLAVHSKNSVNHLIQNNFFDYFESIKFDTDKNIWINDKLGVRWNHDKDITKEGKDKLITRYKTRIQNFFHAINSNKKILLVHNTFGHNDTNSPTQTILKLMEHKNFTLLIIDHSGNIQTSFHKNVIIHKSIYPWKDFNWSLNKCYTTESGIEFEKNIVDLCKSIITEHI